MKFSSRCKVKEVHCSIKCHKSRSDLSKAKTTNDRYLVGDFDILVSNLSNAVIAGATFTEQFRLIDNEGLILKLAEYYNVSPTYQNLFDVTFDDWRCARSSEIAVAGVIPRTPIVMLENDPIWKSLDNIEELLLEIVQERVRDRKNITLRK